LSQIKIFKKCVYIFGQFGAFEEPFTFITGKRLATICVPQNKHKVLNSFFFFNILNTP